MIDFADAIRIIGGFAGAWLAVRIELRWLRSDIVRAHTRLDDHDVRIRQIEIGD